MTIERPGRELVVLTADLDAENAMKGILSRHQAIGIRSLSGGEIAIYRHPYRDPGCRSDAELFLRSFSNDFRFALVLFDHQGCGWEDRTAEDIETDVEIRLARTGWNQRCGAVVLSPELEAWVWSDSPHVDAELGWTGRRPSLREWLLRERFLSEESPKPSDPKAALWAALREVRKPPSPRIFTNLARNVSLSRCQDRAFHKLRNLLQQWFRE